MLRINDNAEKLCFVVINLGRKKTERQCNAANLIHYAGHYAYNNAHNVLDIKQREA
jgi:hypothetical protein